MKKKLITLLIVTVIIGLLFGLAVKVASKLALFNIFLAVTPSETLFPETNILVLGVDDVFGHRSDTIMVLHTDPAKKNLFLVSLPRDTLVAIPGRGLDKINHAYAYGGIELTRQTVESLLKTQIPYYIIVNLAGIEKLIDELGGITIDVENRMYYIDYAGNLYIDLKPGCQVLSGKNAVAYLRYRSDGGDFKRIARQQKFVKAFADKLWEKENLFRSPAVVFNLLSNISTNLKSREILGLGLNLRAAFELAQVETTTLPGFDLMVDGIYYLRPDEQQLKNLSEKFSKKLAQ